MLDNKNIELETQHHQNENLMLGIFLLLYIVAFPSKLPKLIFEGEPLLLIQAVMYLILGIGSVLVFRRELIASLRIWKSSPFKNMMWFIGAFVADMILANLAIYPAYLAGYDDLMGNSTGVSLLLQTIGKPLTVFVVGIMGPIVEECVFRGFLIGKCKTKIPVWLCIVLSSISFALLHLKGLSIGDFLVVLPGLTSGLVYGITYAKTGNITLPILIHLIGNFMAAIFL